MFVLKVEETPDLWPEESARAGTPVTCYDHVEPMQWRHLNVFNKECMIVYALSRGCRSNVTVRQSFQLPTSFNRQKSRKF
jgi:hypothetical protein